MSKAILVMDMPSSCFYCDLCHTRDYDHRRKLDGNKFCGVEDLDVNEYYSASYDDELIKPEWCPLKKLPNRKNGNDELFMYDTDNHYEQGWNACLDEIVRE